MAKPTPTTRATHTAPAPEPADTDAEDLGFGFMPGVTDGDFEAQRTGTFPPYWKPDQEQLEAGVPQGFVGQVLDYDSRDPNFRRWVMLAKTDLLCHTGPAADGEEVHVKAGEEFSISDFHGLDLTLYMGLTVAVRAVEKIALTKSAHTLWRWKLGCHKADVATLNTRRQAAALEGRAAGQTKQVKMPATQAATS